MTLVVTESVVLLEATNRLYKTCKNSYGFCKMFSDNNMHLLCHAISTKRPFLCRRVSKLYPDGEDPNDMILHNYKMGPVTSYTWGA